MLARFNCYVTLVNYRARYTYGQHRPMRRGGAGGWNSAFSSILFPLSLHSSPLSLYLTLPLLSLFPLPLSPQMTPESHHGFRINRDEAVHQWQGMPCYVLCHVSPAPLPNYKQFAESSAKDSSRTYALCSPTTLEVVADGLSPPATRPWQVHMVNRLQSTKPLRATSTRPWRRQRPLSRPGVR